VVAIRRAVRPSTKLVLGETAAPRRGRLRRCVPWTRASTAIGGARAPVRTADTAPAGRGEQTAVAADDDARARSALRDG
jgi:hypothetical protein